MHSEYIVLAIVVMELAVSGAAPRWYFRWGLPLYRRRVPMTEILEAEEVGRLIEQVSRGKSVLGNPDLVTRVFSTTASGDGLIGAREKKFAGIRFTASWPTRMSVLVSSSRRQIEIRLLANWGPLALILGVLSVSLSLPSGSHGLLAVMPFGALFLALYWRQVQRVGEVVKALREHGSLEGGDEGSPSSN